MILLKLAIVIKLKVFIKLRVFNRDIKRKNKRRTVITLYHQKILNVVNCFRKFFYSKKVLVVKNVWYSAGTYMFILKNSKSSKEDLLSSLLLTGKLEICKI